MKVDALFLADAADVFNGKAYIHGGAIDTIFTAALPTLSRFDVVVIFRCPWGETNQMHQVSADILDGDGNSLLPAAQQSIQVVFGRPPMLGQGEDQMQALVIHNPGLMLNTSGAHAVVVRIDGEDAWRVPFYVRSGSGIGQQAPTS